MGEIHAKSMPRVQYLSYVDSAITLCSGAALVEVKQGLSKIRYCHVQERENRPKEWFSVLFEEKRLADIKVNNCGTCGCLLTHGYGGGVMTEEAQRAVRDQINGGYHGMKVACEAIGPLLGLFPSGQYLVADFLLLPMADGEHFMDTPEYKSELHFTHLHIGGQFELNEMPHFLFPTQEPSRLDQQTVEQYRRRIREEGEAFPRAIAMYLNGAVALLLDGHHKAVAAALEGMPVRTLVIFPVKAAPALKKHIADKKRIFLHRAKQGEKKQPGVHVVYEHHELPLLDMDGKELGCALSLQSMETEKKEQEFTGFDQWMLPDVFRPEKVDWKLRPDVHIRAAGSLRPTEIKELLAALKPLPEDALYERETFFALSAYAAFFPDSKWLSEADRQWLLEKLAHYDYYLLKDLPIYGSR